MYMPEDVEHYMMTPDEQIASTFLKYNSLDKMNSTSIIGIYKNMLGMEAKAQEEISKKQYRLALRHCWRFFQLYKESVHKIRTSPLVPIRTRSLLEEKAMATVATVQWLIKKHKTQEAINYKRHLKDEQRRNAEIKNERPKTITTDKIGGWSAKSSLRSSRGTSWRAKSSVKFSQIEGLFHNSQKLLHGMDDVYHRNTWLEQSKNRLVAYVAKSVMRNVYLPSQTVVTFQSISCRNDFKAIKTMAILAASSVSHSPTSKHLKQQVQRIVISHILLPQQVATTDTCSITNYSEVDDYMTNHQLLHVGYIYTEPRREAELCALEAHELCRLRSRLPEAFAIVISNVFSEVKFIILTDDGYEDLMKCKEEGIHPHNFQRPMVKESVHLILSDEYQITLMDFRKEIQTIK